MDHLQNPASLITFSEITDFELEERDFDELDERGFEDDVELAERGFEEYDLDERGFDDYELDLLD